MHDRQRHPRHGGDVQLQGLRHGHRDQTARGDDQCRTIACRNLIHRVIHTGVKGRPGFGRAFQFAVSPIGKDGGQVVGELALLGGMINAVLFAEQGRKVEIFQLVQAWIADGFHPGVHAFRRLDMAAQGTGIKAAVVMRGVAQVVAQPACLPMAQITQLVIAQFVFGRGIGLTVADQGDVGHVAAFFGCAFDRTARGGWKAAGARKVTPQRAQASRIGNRLGAKSGQGVGNGTPAQAARRL